MTASTQPDDGPVAVITGAGAGLGAALAAEAAARGMRVVLADIDGASIERAAAAFEAAGTAALAIPTDVTDPAAVQALADAAIARFGQVDLLLNNAGIEALGLSWELSPAQWERTLAVNVIGPANGIRAFVPHMLARGEAAVVANVCSLGAILTVPFQAPYIASKHAALSLTETLELELRSIGAKVRACAVLPGMVDTDIFLRATAADAMGQENLESMHGLLGKTGMAPHQAARNILDGIASGAFWVSTHPEQMEHTARFWGGHIASLSQPSRIG